MKPDLWFPVLTVALLWSAAIRSGGDELPAARIAPVSGSAPVIDGHLDEPCWKTAVALTRFVISQKEGPHREARFRTEAYLLRDARVFYIGARCFEPMETASSSDWFEVFVADRELFSYYHFWVHASGETGQDGSPGIFPFGSDLLWHAATSRQADHWQVEIAIPFFVFSPEHLSDDVWRFNLCRQKRSAPLENSQWSNTGGYFHVPAKFGVLSGMAGIDFSPPPDASTSVKLPKPGQRRFPDYLLLDRSYYTSEEVARLRLTVNEQTRARIAANAVWEVSVEDSSGGSVSRSAVPVSSASRYELSLPLRALPVGTYLVRSRLVSRGEVLCRHQQKLQKLPPRPNEVKIDRFSRLLLVNGRHFVPLITEVMFSGRKLSGGDTPDNALEVVARESGFSSLMLWGASPYTRQEVQEAGKTGMKVIISPPGIAQAFRQGGHEAVMRRFVEMCEECRDETNLLAWFIADEGNLFADEVQFAQRFAVLKETDPYHPIFRNESGWQAGYGGPGGLDTTEIYCGGYGGWRLIEAINVDAVPRGVPALALQAWFGPPEMPRYPTPDEATSWVYQILIHGACGACVWGAHAGKPPVPTLWAAVKKLRTEIDTLTPAFAAEEIPGAFSSNPSVHLTLRRVGSTYVLICVNVSGHRQEATLTLPRGVQPRGTVRTLFEQGTERPSDGTVATSFAPLERRVYVW